MIATTNSQGKLLDNASASSEACRCHICGHESIYFDSAKILRRHDVQYFRCTECGFIQTERPHWLDEAYTAAIARQDTGILHRNLLNETITRAVLNLFFAGAKTYLDYGSGHGIFVRLMRDAGFDFSWYDLYATNDYARGFEHRVDSTYDFLTSFEVLEHLVNPLDELSKMMSLSSTVFVSTELLPAPAPKVSDWWYYSLASGQHIAFYTPRSLQLIANRFERHLTSCGPYHLFTMKPINHLLFRLAVHRKLAGLFSTIRRRKSLAESDWDHFSK